MEIRCKLFINNFMILPDTELEIMRVLWCENKPTKVGDLVKILADTRGWKRQTIHSLLSRLESKGFVSADRSGYFHYFFPLISENEYLATASSKLAHQAGGSVHTLLASLIEEEAISDDDILSISEMMQAKCAEILEKRRKENL